VSSLLPACVAVGIQAILVISVNLVSGYARRLSLGQAAFAGLGAYVSASLSVQVPLSFWLACPLSVLSGAITGLIVGLPMLGRMPYYVPVITLTLNLLVPPLLRPGRFVGHPPGMGRIPPPWLFDMAFSPGVYLVLVGVALVGCLAADWCFRQSCFGQRLRDDAEAIEAGLSAPGVAGLAAFGLSTAMAGLAGSLLAHFEAFISPFDFNLEASLFILALAVAGGLGSVWRVLLSAVVLGGMVEGIRALTDYHLLLSGVIFLLAGLRRPWGQGRT
jgi:branched-chain amino acid transport system permease protein